MSCIIRQKNKIKIKFDSGMFFQKKGQSKGDHVNVHSAEEEETDNAVKKKF